MGTRGWEGRGARHGPDPDVLPERVREGGEGDEVRPGLAALEVEQGLGGEAGDVGELLAAPAERRAPGGDSGRDRAGGRGGATDGRVRRTSHRSRVALRSLLRGFRAGFPQRFAPTRTRGGDSGPGLAPTEDWQWDLAFETCAGFRNPLTRRHARALLLLCRAAGLDGGDVRFVTGGDVERRAGAGLWVVVRRRAAQRAVPVLARYADRLEDLAVDRPARCLVAGVPAPCQSDTASTLAGLVNRQLRRAGHDFTVSAARMRKAWLIEHVAANVPVNTLCRAAGLVSLRSIERLVIDHGPQPPGDDECTARALGGIAPRRRTSRNRPE